MTFKKEKEKYISNLYKPDNSKKGNVDKEISKLIDEINSKSDFYTTSSCAGRIVLITIPKSGRKDHANWLFKSHKLIDFKDIPLTNLPNETVWFRQEGAVLHVCCKTIEKAQILVDYAKTAGFKRTGIMATKKRVMVEVSSTESIDVPISKNGKILISKDYVEVLVDEANKKLKKNSEKSDKFYKLLKSIK